MTVTITTASLPQAVGANAYSQALTACGGNQPVVRVLVDDCQLHGQRQRDAGVTRLLVQPGRWHAAARADVQFGGVALGDADPDGDLRLLRDRDRPGGDASAPTAYSVTVVAGMSVTTADGSYSDGGPITAGSVTVSPDGTGEIDSVVTANGSDDHAIAGTAADNQIGVSVTDVGSFCHHGPRDRRCLGHRPVERPPG